MLTVTDTSARADLVAGIHAPFNATVSECLTRWSALNPTEQSRSYLVLHGNAGARRTLNASAICKLTHQIARAHQHAL
jgi:hypothetical protein